MKIVRLIISWLRGPMWAIQQKSELALGTFQKTVNDLHKVNDHINLTKAIKQVIVNEELANIAKLNMHHEANTKVANKITEFLKD